MSGTGCRSDKVQQRKKLKLFIAEVTALLGRCSIRIHYEVMENFHGPLATPLATPSPNDF